jgi:hypothetical protein
MRRGGGLGIGMFTEGLWNAFSTRRWFLHPLVLFFVSTIKTALTGSTDLKKNKRKKKSKVKRKVTSHTKINHTLKLKNERERESEEDAESRRRR